MKAEGERLAERWRAAVSALKTWKKGGERAVHKPLLTLLLIARAQSSASGAIAFQDIEAPLEELLREFGPPRRSYHPEYPFWHLQSDGIWELRDAASYPLRRAGHSPSRSVLRSRDATGAVPAPLWRVLCADAELRHELASRILEDYWPASLHESIRQAVGLSAVTRSTQTVRRAKRDPFFRDAVLRAYERRCAVCGYDGRLGRDDLALEAAHIRWHCYGGPDEVDNGLALCSFHHVAFDRGALGLTEHHNVTVSADVNGSEMVDTMLLRFVGQPLRGPQPGSPEPAAPFVRWHQQQVFRSPMRA
ncbi:MAG: phosphorothioated DNA-binding restriction endonuclease [Planctomycetota bacterium]